MASEMYIPPRFRWFKRIACAGAAYVLFLIGLRIWWGWEADRRFQAAVERRRAVGEPVLLEDFVRPAIPDGENAAYFFGRAAQAIKLPAGVKRVRELLEGWDDPSDAWREQASAFLERNREVLRLIRTARSCPAVDWKSAPVSAASRRVPPYPPYYLFQDDLARVALLSVVEYHRAGDDRAALDAVRDMLAIGRGAAEGTAFEQLTRVRVEDMVIAALEEITPGLRVDVTASGAESEAVPVSRREVEELIDDLLTGEFEEDWTRCLYRERIKVIDEAQCMANGKIPVLPPHMLPAGSSVPLRAAVWFVKPAWLIDCTLIADQIDEFSKPGLGDWASTTAHLPAVENGCLAHDVARYAIWYPAYERMAPLMYQIPASRRMAAAALAIRVYELDHGRRPASLDDVVPEYLAAVPRDPFAAEGRPIGYAPHRPQPLLYSVNKNGLDEGGAFALRPSGAINAFAADYPYFLNGDRPRAKATAAVTASKPSAVQSPPAAQPASMQAVPDDHEIENAQGDESR